MSPCSILPSTQKNRATYTHHHRQMLLNLSLLATNSIRNTSAKKSHTGDRIEHFDVRAYAKGQEDKITHWLASVAGGREAFSGRAQPWDSFLTISALQLNTGVDYDYCIYLNTIEISGSDPRDHKEDLCFTVKEDTEYVLYSE